MKWRLLNLLIFWGFSAVCAEDLPRYFFSRAPVHNFNQFEAKIWIRINRIPELRWKKIEIPPTRDSTSDFPKTILVHGTFQKEGKGKRSLAVNGTNVRVSDAGDFILKVHTQGTEFGLLVTFTELNAAEELKQTLGFRIFSVNNNPKSASSSLLGFLGKTVYNQRKMASLNLPEQVNATVEPPPIAEKLDAFRLYLGASVSNYEQNTSRQSPKTSFLRFNYERNLKPVLSSPVWLGFDSRFSVIPLNMEAGGALQFLNSEIKAGLVLHQSDSSQIRLFTGTNYFTTFGNQSLGFFSGLGQSLELDTKWKITSDWELGLYGKATLIPPSRGTGSFFSNREVLSGVNVSHKEWGIFSEVTHFHLSSSQEVDLSSVRFGFFTRF
ncbi:MAG: hypothetical protein EBQ92_12305 [Proteobacteria bacterium]|nr:hypothetical protein [Pseudomonadota bacterium]